MVEYGHNCLLRYSHHDVDQLCPCHPRWGDPCRIAVIPANASDGLELVQPDVM